MVELCVGPVDSNVKVFGDSLFSLFLIIGRMSITVAVSNDNSAGN